MTEAEKQLFEARVRELLGQAAEARKNTVFAMMEPSLAALEPDAPAVVLAYPGRAWEQNSNGVLHGGIIASMMDVAMGTLTYGLTGKITPTVNLNVSYPRPAAGSGSFLLRAELVKAGRSLLYTTGTFYEADAPERVVAAAQGVFFNAAGDYLGEK